MSVTTVIIREEQVIFYFPSACERHYIVAAGGLRGCAGKRNCQQYSSELKRALPAAKASLNGRADVRIMAQVAKRQRDKLAVLRGVILQTDKQARVSSQIGPWSRTNQIYKLMPLWNN